MGGRRAVGGGIGGGGGGLGTMARGDIGVYPMLLGQLPGAGPLLAKDCFFLLRMTKIILWKRDKVRVVQFSSWLSSPLLEMSM